MEFTKFRVIGQIFTLLSYLIYWTATFIKDKKNMLLMDNLSRTVAIISFIFLKTYDGIKNTIFVVFRNTIGQTLIGKDKIKKVISFLILLSILVIMYCFNFNGISTIFIAISGVINLFGVIFCKPQNLRICSMIGSLNYCAFMLFTNNHIGLICETLTFIIILVSYVKYIKK